MSRTIQLQSIQPGVGLYARIATTFFKKGKGDLPDISIHLEKASLKPDALKKLVSIVASVLSLAIFLALDPLYAVN